MSRHPRSAAACLAAWCAVALVPAQESRPALRAELKRLFGEQRYDEMLRAVEPALLEAGPSADLWIMAAEAAFKLEDFERAIACFERGVKLDAGLAPATINLGFAYLKVERLDEARAVFERFRKDANRDRAGKALYGIGLVLSARGDAEEARKSFADAVALDPSDPRPHYRLGQIALQGGDHAGAIRSFTSAITHDELHYGAAYGLARAHAAAGDSAESARWAERHRRILEATDAVAGMIRRLGQAADPGQARVAIGDRLMEAGARGRAAPWYRRALELDPSNREARRRLELAAEPAAESRR